MPRVTKEESEFELVDDGTYLVELVGVTEGDGKFGPTINWEFEIVEDEDFEGIHVGGLSSARLTDSDKNKLRKWLIAFGFDPDSVEVGDDFELSNFVGQRAMATIETSKGKKGEFSNVVDLIALRGKKKKKKIKDEEGDEDESRQKKKTRRSRREEEDDDYDDDEDEDPDEEEDEDPDEEEDEEDPVEDDIKDEDRGQGKRRKGRTRESKPPKRKRRRVEEEDDEDDVPWERPKKKKKKRRRNRDDDED